MTRVFRLCLLAPEIVEAILYGNGKQGPALTLARLLEPFPMEWAVQQRLCHLIVASGAKRPVASCPIISENPADELARATIKGAPLKVVLPG